MRRANILYNRSDTTFHSHVWILNKLLTWPEPLDELLSYVISTCYKKIHRRLTHSLSKSYRDSLCKVTSFKFSEPSSDQSEETTGRKDSDDALFSLFDMLPLQSKFPELNKQAALIKAGKPYALYTQHTYLEFHKLVCELLESFTTAVAQLLASRGKSADPTQGSKTCKDSLNLAVAFGYALLQLVSGSGSQRYFQNIASVLDDHRRVELSRVVEGDEMEEEHDDDLRRLQQVVNDQPPEPLWKSYRDWLRLILAHFDAVETLANCVTSPQFSGKAIYMKILVTPNVDTHMLPWRDLFAKQVFPEHSVGDKLTTNDNLLQFLLEVISSGPDEAATFVKGLRIYVRKINTADDGTAIDMASFVCSKPWPDHQLPGWKQGRTAIMDDFKKLANCSTPAEFQSCISNINGTFDSLLDTIKFFKSLERVDKFKGSLHCEACLVALLKFSPNSTSSSYPTQFQVTCVIFILAAVRF